MTWKNCLLLVSFVKQALMDGCEMYSNASLLCIYYFRSEQFLYQNFFNVNS